ncbi:MAG: hypothetical protein R3342_05630 [Lutibacter sp.]|uniref:hypothetical protein n=1 Tax=Lutibacter sp. TaxID=1925666 RepID=UPI00299DCDC5|nr:hypothetical protein [Lutibacter sp.]MDX1829010.1 hypothetical protein [Lutibacter sp.]
MKKISLILGILLTVSCSSTKFVDSWRNQKIKTFTPKKLLVIGMTDNLTAQNIFEEDLKKAFVLRNINAVESTTVLDENFTKTEKSEEEINQMIKEISAEGFDAVIITAVKGVKKLNYPPRYYTIGYRWTRFGHYYLNFQDVYYTPQYYESYKVYNIETSIYYINKEDDKSLVWVGSLELVDPKTIKSTVKKYVDKIIKQLERESLIKTIN